MKMRCLTWLGTLFLVAVLASCSASPRAYDGVEKAKEDTAEESSQPETEPVGSSEVADEADDVKPQGEPEPAKSSPPPMEERVDEPTSPPATGASTPEDPSVAPGERGLAKPTGDEVVRRVEAARQRLQKTDAGKLIWSSIQSHGGLTKWFTNGPVYFRFNYRPLGDRPAHDTYQTVDQWQSRARHQMASDRAKEFGWDGEQAWKEPGDWEPPYNLRFWALTPYYFMGMPFVLADPGVKLELIGEGKLEGKKADIVKATFGEGVGDAPDDYYVLYIGKDAKRVLGLRYIVSYKGFYPDGGHGAEKLMTYDGEQTIEGLTFAESYRTFKWEEGEKGEKVTETTLSDVKFKPKTPSSFFDVPTNAAVIQGY